MAHLKKLNKYLNRKWDVKVVPINVFGQEFDADLCFPASTILPHIINK